MSTDTASRSSLQTYGFQAYLFTVSIFGLILFTLGLGKVFVTTYPTILLLLFILVIGSSAASTSLRVNDKSGITYHIGSAIALASVPLFGVHISALLIGISSITLWFIKPENRTTWKKTNAQLFFNTGMLGVSAFIAGFAFLGSRALMLKVPLLANTLPWVLMGITFEIVNTLLLMFILFLQNGKLLNLLDFYRGELTASVVGIAINTVGAGFLAYAMSNLGWVGVIAFFLPIATSTFAYENYVSRFEDDVSRLEDIVEARTKELQDLSKRKDAFLTVLTHDMKSPLTSINVNAQLLKRKPELAIEKPRITDAILQSQTSLMEIVNNILDIDKLEAGQSLELEMEIFDLSETLDLLQMTLEENAHAKLQTLTIEYPQTGLYVRGDRFQLRRVFANIISNAIKYTPQHGIINVTGSNDGETCSIKVKDTGYGIPPDEIETIFDRFSRVRSHKNLAAGTGLGLSIAKAIVEAHGGDILVSSRVNEGSVFTINLPTME